MARLKRVTFLFDVDDPDDKYSDMEIASLCMEPLMGGDFAGIVIPLDMTVDDRPVEDSARVVNEWDKIARESMNG